MMSVVFLVSYGFYALREAWGPKGGPSGPEEASMEDKGMPWRRLEGPLGSLGGGNFWYTLVHPPNALLGPLAPLLGLSLDSFGALWRPWICFFKNYLVPRRGLGGPITDQREI